MNRFWKHAKLMGQDECWEWQGTLRPDGYGLFWMNGSMNHRAHRVAYELSIGPIPDGYTLDHTCHTNDSECPGGVCRHRRCVNPAHLEPVLREVNKARGKSRNAINARKTHCVAGHLLDAANTYVNSRGHRQCKECGRIRNRMRYRQGRRPQRGKWFVSD